MPKVTVKVFATLIEIIGKRILEEEASTVKELLEKIYEKYPKVKEELEEGYIILVNGHNIEHLQGLETPLKEGDTVSIFPPAGGG
ncbi:molybdopterin synthase sulfur carrier subunit [Thermococcus chitonophagus]|uniref:Molybdenum cofactor biosynthesis protein MoaD n=1 Tax=Thermococcus chitonophagus TaxID=54262 RepID=A0A160VVH3_9EURY|nr:ubiquitin-like small modifier protein 1 [Thermococcus chitonophagus]ASJ17142.1 molybdopterin synthase sulfur carrier subunit [Thermococcus chitonophagus]CUX77751.1 Molybdenum cofactor biosynthesis protein MoaD [Thermococcus chitonophagus]